MNAEVRRRICKVPFATVLAILMTALFALYSILPVAAITRIGVQCPTAPIQKITVAAVKCCGKVVSIKRVPKPGDKAFLQCRCAEKGASQQKLAVQTKTPLIFADAILVTTPAGIPGFFHAHVYELSYSSVESSPSVQPPMQV
jgi:hypothetical protein